MRAKYVLEVVDIGRRYYVYSVARSQLISWQYSDIGVTSLIGTVIIIVGSLPLESVPQSHLAGFADIIGTGDPQPQYLVSDVGQSAAVYIGSAAYSGVQAILCLCRISCLAQRIRQISDQCKLAAHQTFLLGGNAYRVVVIG